jgi:WD40 repeat protein
MGDSAVTLGTVWRTLRIAETVANRTIAGGRHMAARTHSQIRGVLCLLIGVAPSAELMAQNLDIQGKVLAEIDGYRISLFDLQTKTEDTLLVIRDVIPHYGRLRSPNFSPDGRRICFTLEDNVPTVCRIYVADNDGSNITHLCDYTNQDVDNMNWCTDGYIYWCENTDNIYRVNVLTREKET